LFGLTAEETFLLASIVIIGGEGTAAIGDNDGIAHGAFALAVPVTTEGRLQIVVEKFLQNRLGIDRAVGDSSTEGKMGDHNGGRFLSSLGSVSSSHFNVVSATTVLLKLCPAWYPDR